MDNVFFYAEFFVGMVKMSISFFMVVNVVLIRYVNNNFIFYFRGKEEIIFVRDRFKFCIFSGIRILI